MSISSRGPGVPFGTSFTADAGSLAHRSDSHPMKATPYVSAFVGQVLSCPSCKTPLTAHADRFTCERCSGVFVENGALVELMSTMRSNPWELTPAEGPPGPRVCPVCAAAMTLERVETIELERCPQHGVWFDRDELADALLRL